ncbi:spore germination protein [Brevibacillus ginsengisoli]|uniref:spore germination protein n=1 Tax=Brevibacillus ginsengisoli TaxID=363854 RepID=UPI003CF41DC8
MPSIVGAVNITSNSGAVNFGDTLKVSPKSISKSYKGSGSDNNANVMIANNWISSTNTIDDDVADNTQVANA